jgi:hypothetical protein
MHCYRLPQKSLRLQVAVAVLAAEQELPWTMLLAVKILVTLYP